MIVPWEHAIFFPWLSRYFTSNFLNPVFLIKWLVTTPITRESLSLNSYSPSRRQDQTWSPQVTGTRQMLVSCIFRWVWCIFPFLLSNRSICKGSSLLCGMRWRTSSGQEVPKANRYILGLIQKFRFPSRKGTSPGLRMRVKHLLLPKLFFDLCDLWAGSTRITWKLVRKVTSRAPPKNIQCPTMYTTLEDDTNIKHCFMVACIWSDHSCWVLVFVSLC